MAAMGFGCQRHYITGYESVLLVGRVTNAYHLDLLAFRTANLLVFIIEKCNQRQPYGETDVGRGPKLSTI